MRRPAFGRARSCIVLFLMGGPPQHSTWDPKPDAPAEVRGDFGPIATTVPGLCICELMPRTALVADKLCLLRACPRATTPTPPAATTCSPAGRTSR